MQVNGGAFSPRTPAKTTSILKGAKSPRSSQRNMAVPGPSTKPAAVAPKAAPVASGSQTERRYDQVGSFLEILIPWLL